MARPNIVGQVVRCIDMRHTSSSSNKDYRITITGVSPGQYRVYTEHGPADRLQNGRELTSSPVSQRQADRLAVEACEKKMQQRDAYSVLRDNHTPPSATTQAPAPVSPPTPKRVCISADTLSTASRSRLSAVF